MSDRATPLTIGWKEYAAFPDWHIRGLAIKADTGARTGAIDCAEIEEVGDGDVEFVIRLHRKSGDVSRRLRAKIARRTRVRSAFGHAHDRYFVETTLKLGQVTKTIELGLVSRKKMICRVLLGRKALEGDFLVDSGRRYMLGRKRSRSTGKKSVLKKKEPT